MDKRGRDALAEGRDAAVTAWVAARPLPGNPYGVKSKRAAYWDWGCEQAARLINQIEGIGA
jgi:hypothetical protein